MDNLFYISQDEIRIAPRTDKREASDLFYPTRRDALLALKLLCEERANHYVCKIVAIEKDLANERKG